MPESPIGLICAIPQERIDLKAALDHQGSIDLAGLTFDYGRLEGRDVVLAEAGIGKVNVALVSALLASRFSASSLIFSGVAGGLDPDLGIGDLVISNHAIQHDCGVIENETLQAYQAGHVPFFNPTDQLGFSVDQALLKRVESALDPAALTPLSSKAGGTGQSAKLVYGTILAGDQYIHCEATRQRLQREFGAKAVAMEGGAMAQVAERFQKPWLEIRALSDLAGASSKFDFATFVDEVAKRSATVLRQILPNI